VLPPADFELLGRLTQLQREKPLHLDDLAKALGMSASLLQRRLKKLVAEGWVERHQEASPHGRIVRYLPVPRVSVQWVSPWHGAAISWSTRGEIIWEFPLISQVPDAWARTALHMFFAEVAHKGLIRGGPWFEGSTFVSGGLGAAAIVYGSTARGTATSSSDIDLLLITEDDDNHEVLRDLAASVSLEAYRDLQLKIVSMAHVPDKRGGYRRLPRLPAPIDQAIREDGIIIYDGLHHGPLWAMVYGGRTRGR
jgi:predicted nucleotidyltransferase